jgi:hypothetical protein
MLEEIIACFLSLFSVLTLNAPRLSRELNDNTSPSNQRTRYTWNDKIHEEYVSFEEDNLPSETEYVQLGYELRNSLVEGELYHNLSCTAFGTYRDGSYIF